MPDKVLQPNDLPACRYGKTAGRWASEALSATLGEPVPTTETLERFVARVEQNAHVEAVEEFYTEHSTMQENQGTARRGRDAHAAAERTVMARAKSLTSECVRPVFVSGHLVVIRWIFKFQWQDGTSTHMEELAYQRWEGEKIAEETFFYDPAQRTPKVLIDSLPA